MCCTDHSPHVQFGETALNAAAKNGHTDTVKYLLENTSVQVDVTDYVSDSNCEK